MSMILIAGFFCGGYHYTLKMFLFEKVRARNFARAWGFVQFFQAVPIAIGGNIFLIIQTLTSIIFILQFLSLDT